MQLSGVYVMKRWFRLVYPPELLNQPVIYQLIKHYDVVTNIFQAQVDKNSGWLVLEMQGTEVVLTEAGSWLREQGLIVEELKTPPSSGAGSRKAGEGS